MIAGPENSSIYDKTTPNLFYLDHCGTTPLSGHVSKRLQEIAASDLFGNPSASHHVIGGKAHEALTEARLKVSSLLGGEARNIYFTSGATEANNLVLWGFALRYRAKGATILYGATEHKSVHDVCEFLSGLEGVSTQKIPVSGNGSIDVEHLEQTLQKQAGKPTLVALMHINNEIPVRHPIEDIGSICRKHGAFFHCDGVQGYVRESIHFGDEVFGSYVISSHKVYGPKGLGILWLGDGDLSPRIVSPIRGGDQEFGLRPGTENLLAILSGIAALELHEESRKVRIEHMESTAKAFVDELLSSCDKARLTVPVNAASPGIVSFYFQNIEAQSLLNRLPQLCLNRGASCLGAGGERYSHVAKALGLPVEIQANILRASFGDSITENESRLAAQILAAFVNQL